MILNSIELENIRSYEREKIEFPRGITLFEGDIGSGKSSVLMGIEFALFGLGSQKADSLLSKKASEGSVALEFEVEGKRYTVKRKLKRKGDSVNQDAKDSYLISDGQTEPLSPSELKQRILQILKFNEPSDPRSESRIFRYAVFTPQEEMKQILKDTQKRLETIRKAFGIEDYRIISDNAKHLTQKIREQMVGFEVRFERMGEDEQTIQKILHDIEQMSATITSFDEELGSLEKKKKTLTDELSRLQEQAKEKENLENQKEKFLDKIKNNNSTISIFESQISSCSKEISDIEASILTIKKVIMPTKMSVQTIDAKIKELSELRDKIQEKKTNLMSLEMDIAKIKNSLGDFIKLSDNNYDLVKQDLTEIKAKEESCQRELEQLRAKKILSEKESEDNKTLLENIQNAGAKCPHCEHVLTDEHKKMVENERRLKMQEIEHRLKDLAEKLAQKTNLLDELKRQRNQKEILLMQIEKTAPLREQWIEKNHTLTSIKQEMPELESGLVAAEEPNFPMEKGEDVISYLRRLRDAKKEHDDSERKLVELETRKRNLVQTNGNAQSQIEQLRKSVVQLNNELDNISDQLVQFSDLDPKISKKSEDLTATEENFASVKEILIKNRQILSNEKAKVNEIQNRISEAKKWQEKHKKFSNYNDWLREFFIPTLERIEKQVLLSIQQNFNDVYRKWYSVLIEDDTKESKIDEDFTPLVEQDGFVQDVDFLSGGEKTSIALAYRLALNSMMRQGSNGLKSNLLILDEPTDGFSKAQLSKVRNLLQELKSQQIILVSHEKELETYVDNIFYITKDSGVSKVIRLGV